MTYRYTIIQDTWFEEDDKELHEYCENNNILTKFLPKEDILEIKDFSLVDCLFADTTIIQQVLNKKAMECYPFIFNNFYKRNIRKINLNTLVNYEFPYFVKPYANDKSFDANIIKNKKDLDDFFREINYDIKNLNIMERKIKDLRLKRDKLKTFDNNKNDIVKQIFNLDEEILKLNSDYIYIKSNMNRDIYISNLVEFKNEFRLFIYDKTKYHLIETSEWLIIPQLQNYKNNDPTNFIDEIIKINPYEYCIIDIGQIDNDQWTIVEVNPPYALTSYGLDIEKYYEYCKKAWLYMLN